VLTVEDWAEIRRLHRAEGMPVKAIVRLLGISRNTVRAALASDAPPKYRGLLGAEHAPCFELAVAAAWRRQVPRPQVLIVIPIQGVWQLTKPAMSIRV
jgi:hypothetical protein